MRLKPIETGKDLSLSLDASFALRDSDQQSFEQLLILVRQGLRLLLRENFGDGWPSILGGVTVIGARRLLVAGPTTRGRAHQAHSRHDRIVVEIINAT